MFDLAISDYGTPRLAARCAGSLNVPDIRSVQIVDAKAKGLSYAESINGALKHGAAPYVGALNADTWMIDRASLRIIATLFNYHPDVAVIGPRQVNNQGRLVHAGIIGNNHVRTHRFWQTPLPEADHLCAENLLDVPTVTGSVYFCRREVWEQHGGFYEGCRHYFEETALDFKIRHAGWRVCYTGATTFGHLWQSSPLPQSWLVQKAAESQKEFVRHMRELGIDAS